MTSTHRIVHADALEIATEAFGNPLHPPILLIMGAAASMLWWPDEFCELLAGKGFFVIRYDNRDTGQTTTGEPGSVNYGLDEMADDTMRVLDAYDLPSAHLVGMSLGGMIAQLAALKYPQRVKTVTAISSAKFNPENPAVPLTNRNLTAHFDKLASLDWSNRDDVTDFLVEAWRLSAGRAHAFDFARARELAGREYDHARNLRSAFNHAMLTGGKAWRGRIDELVPPLLVIHGTEDPILPVQHGYALAKAVPYSRIVILEGSGHELHAADWDTIIAQIVAHTSRRREAAGTGL